MGSKREPFEENTFYHVYNHANGIENIFKEQKNYYYFLLKYKQHIGSVADTYAYCLLPNHFHILLKTRPLAKISLEKSMKKQMVFQDLISQQMSNFFNAYTKAFNKMYDRKGSLFLDNVKRKKIGEESYFTAIVFYIHYNPIHHGFAKRIDTWKHCSYNSLISDKPTLLRREDVLEWFGGKDSFIAFHQQQP